MGDPRALPGFGQLDLDIEDDADGTPPHGSPLPAFGDGAAYEEFPMTLDDAPPSTSRVFGTGGHPTRRTMGAVHEASTRIVSGDVLAKLTAPPPGEGAASRDRGVSAMRELYAGGDAEGALTLAENISDSMRPGAAHPEHADAGVVVEFGDDSSVDLSDPFGGLIPLDATDAIDDDLGVVAHVPPPCAAPHLTLTERHSIPRNLKSLAEIANLPIDHRAGFLLAHVDGMQTLEELLDVCAMPATEALALIAKLEKMGVIELE